MKKTIPADAVLIPEAAKRVFEGVIYDVYQWPQKLFDGSSATFEMLRRPDTVDVIGLVDNKILILRDDQPHRGLRRSFPGGRVDPGEAIEAAAKREMLEETGYSFDHWRLISVRQPHAKIEWFIHTFIAWDGHKIAELHLDAGEKITVDHLLFDAVRQLVFDKAGYLGESAEIFELAKSPQDLLRLPEFSGQVIDC